MSVEAKLEELGLVLPEPVKPPPGVRLPFEFVRTDRRHAYIAGHGPQAPDGSLSPPFGKVGAEVSTEQAYEAARLTALSILASLKRELGDLDRVTQWLRAVGYVHCAPGFEQNAAVVNGFSDLIVELWGDAGRHARSAPGQGPSPLNVPIIVDAIVAVQ